MLALQVWNGREWKGCLFNYKQHEYEKMTEIMIVNSMRFVDIVRCMYAWLTSYLFLDRSLG